MRQLNCEASKAVIGAMPDSCRLSVPTQVSSVPIANRDEKPDAGYYNPAGQESCS